MLALMWRTLSAYSAGILAGIGQGLLLSATGLHRPSGRPAHQRDMSPRMPTRHAGRRAPREAADKNSQSYHVRTCLLSAIEFWRKVIGERPRVGRCFQAMTNNRKPNQEAPLESWKEISNYLQRDVRTVSRWEKEERLPVHRHQHRRGSTVYAYPSELDAWRAARKPKGGEEERTRPGRRYVPALVGGLALLALAAAILRGPILNPPDPLAEAAGSGVVVRQVLSGSELDVGGEISTDGRHLSMVDWSTGDLAVHDLEIGEKRRFMQKISWQDDPEENAYSSRISPDGKRLAFVWVDYGSKSSFFELRVLELHDEADRPQHRVVYYNDEVDWMQLGDWSPDGHSLLVVLTKSDRTHQIAVVSVVDGSLTVLKTLGWRYPEHARFSPDGAYVVYDFAPDEDRLERDIFLLATDGSREIPLVEHRADDTVLGWSPDGKRFLYSSDRNGSRDAWTIRVEGGKPHGAPRLLKRNIGLVEPLGVTGDGSFYYGVRTKANNVYVATLDETATKLVAPPRRLSHRFEGNNTFADWSPDGHYLAYASQPRGGGRPSAWTMVIRDVESGQERELLLKLTNDNRRLRPRWSPDGRFILVAGQDRKGRDGLYRVDPETGEVTAIAHMAQGSSLNPDWSPDGKSIFYTDYDERNTRRMMRWDSETGQAEVLSENIHQAAGLEVFPDGDQIAFCGSGHVSVMSTAGGAPRRLQKIPWSDVCEGVVWLPNSKRLLFARRSGLWGIPVGGGEPQEIEDSKPQETRQIIGLRLHPDGRQVVLTAGIGLYGSHNEVWVMENFLPELKAAK